MYCSGCGTVNPQGASQCLKCGRDLQAPASAGESAIDVALAARSVAPGRAARSRRLTSRVLILLTVGVAVIAGPIIFMSMQLSTYFPDYQARDTASLNSTKPPYDPTAGTTEDFDSGMGLAPAPRPEVVARDVARKANTSKVRVALAAYYSENGLFPAGLDELGGEFLGFTPDLEVYLYQALDNRNDFRLEVTLESNVVSGADVVKEGEVTKLVITGASLF